MDLLPKTEIIDITEEFEYNHGDTFQEVCHAT